MLPKNSQKHSILRAVLGSVIPNHLAHTIFYDKSLYFWKTGKEFTCANDGREFHFVLCSFVCRGQDIVTSSIRRVTKSWSPLSVMQNTLVSSEAHGGGTLAHCMLLKLSFIEPLIKDPIYFYNISRAMSYSIPSFLFPSTWTRPGSHFLRVLPSVCHQAKWDLAACSCTQT